VVARQSTMLLIGAIGLGLLVVGVVKTVSATGNASAVVLGRVSKVGV
jgi:hypothetical protein